MSKRLHDYALWALLLAAFVLASSACWWLDRAAAWSERPARKPPRVQAAPATTRPFLAPRPGRAPAQDVHRELVD